MRIAYDAGHYAEAAQRFVSGNQYAALGFHDLVLGLGQSGGMAGDDSISQAFAEQYDDAATAAVGTYADLIDAFCALAGLTATSSRNHQRANGASAIGAPQGWDPVCGSTDALTPGRPVSVEAFVPPTCLGPNAVDPPTFWGMVEAHLEGFAWPSADTGRVRAAAQVWADAAAEVRRLEPYLLSGLDHLQAQRSPEIGPASAAICQLGEVITGLVDSCTALAGACNDYATAVDEHRELIRDLMRDLAIQVAATQALGAVADLVTLGGGTAAATGVNAGEALLIAVRVLAALRALMDLVRAIAVSKLALVVERLGPLRQILLRFKLVRDAQRSAEIRYINATPRVTEFSWGRPLRYSTGIQTPMQHVWRFHGPLSRVAGKSRFAAHVTPDDVRRFSEIAVRRGTPRATDSAQIDLDLGYTIGVDVYGVASSTIRVIIRGGVIRTAFPI